MIDKFPEVITGIKLFFRVKETQVQVQHGETINSKDKKVPKEAREEQIIHKPIIAMMKLRTNEQSKCQYSIVDPTYF